MAGAQTSGRWHAVAAFLIIVLTLSGFGRAVMAAPVVRVSSIRIAGVVVPICHAGGPDASDPADPRNPARHDCCDQCALCALCAPAVLPAAPRVPQPIWSPVTARRGALASSTTLLARTRTPRQSQGPPPA
jgi:hypothetical protein